MVIFIFLHARVQGHRHRAPPAESPTGTITTDTTTSTGRHQRQHHHHAHDHKPAPHVLAEKLLAEGRPVPGFLLPPHQAGHVPPHLVLAGLVTKARQASLASPTLAMLSEDAWGRFHPAFPPHDRRHVPPHVLALTLGDELAAAAATEPNPTIADAARAAGERHSTELQEM